jgi:hypothetical protein
MVSVGQVVEEVRRDYRTIIYNIIRSFVLCVTCLRMIAKLGECSIDTLVTIPIAYQNFLKTILGDAMFRTRSR